MVSAPRCREVEIGTHSLKFFRKCVGVPFPKDSKVSSAEVGESLESDKSFMCH